jgi:hypothetical protein
MSLDVDIRGMKELQDFIKAFPDHGIRVIDEELFKITNDLRNDIINSMRNTNKSIGNYYGNHKSSSPGFPPAIDTGNLINRMIIRDGYGFSELFLKNVKYAKWLEEGTKKMKARPFFKPAIDRMDWQKRIRNRLIAERFAGRRLDE